MARRGQPPPGAVRTDTPPATFTSYTGWPCGPVEELEAFWVIPDIPAPYSREGIVYAFATKNWDVAVRAEIAAQTESATCPPLPDGGMYGAPGQG